MGPGAAENAEYAESWGRGLRGMRGTNWMGPRAAENAEYAES